MNTKPQPYIPAANWRQIRRKLQAELFEIRRETARRRRRPILDDDVKLPF